MLVSGKHILVFGLLMLLSANRVSAGATNPWALPTQPGTQGNSGQYNAQPYGQNSQNFNGQGNGSGSAGGGFSFGFGFGGRGNAQSGGGSAPAPVAPPTQVAPQPFVPQYGVYPPLDDNNSTGQNGQTQKQQSPQALPNSTLSPPRPPAYGYGYGGYGSAYPYQNYYGGGPFGFNAIPFLNGGFGFGGNFGLFGAPGFVAPGPVPPVYGYPGYGYGQPLYPPAPK